MIKKLFVIFDEKELGITETNVYKFNVPRNVTLSEAPSHGLPAIIYDLKCIRSQAT